MSIRRLALTLLVVVPLALAGCKIRTINYFPPTNADVRTVNLIADAPTVNVANGSTVVWPGVDFQATTGYLGFENSAQTFSVSLPGASSSIISATWELAGEVPYTLIPYGTLAQPQLLLLQNTPLSAGDGRVQFRIGNLAIGSSNVDIYVTAPGVALDTVGYNFYNVGYGGVTQYAGYSSGAYQIRATLTGTKTVVYDSGPVVLGSNTTVDWLLYTKGSSVLFNAVALVIYGNGTVADNTQARIKYVNGALQTGAVNGLVDRVTYVTDLAYGAATVYGITLRGDRTLDFEATATPGAVIASVAKNLGAATDSSVFVAGYPGAQTAIVLADSNLPPPSGKTHVRFVNASPDTPSVNVQVDGVTKVSALASYAASAYVELNGGTYTITFTDPSTGTPLLALPSTSLEGGSVDTVYLIGGTGGLSSVFARDR